MRLALLLALSACNLDTTDPLLAPGADEGLTDKASIQARVDRLERQNEQLIRRLLAAESEIDDLQGRLATAESTLTVHGGDLTFHDNAILGLQDSDVQVSGDLRRVDSQLHVIGGTLTIHDDSILTLQESQMGVQGSLRLIDSQITVLGGDLQTHDDAIVAFGRTNVQQQGQIDALDAELFYGEEGVRISRVRTLERDLGEIQAATIDNPLFTGAVGAQENVLALRLQDDGTVRSDVLDALRGSISGLSGDVCAVNELARAIVLDPNKVDQCLAETTDLTCGRTDHL